MAGKVAAVPVKSRLTDREVSMYYIRLQNDLDMANPLVKGVPGVRFDLGYYTSPNFHINETVREKLHPANDGRIYYETIATVIRMLYILAGKFSKGLTLLGLVQSAKTHSQILSAIFASTIRWLQDGIYTHPIFLIPNMKGTYVAQFSDKFNEVLACHKHLVIHCNGKSISIGDYLENAHYERNKAIEAVSPDAHQLVFSKKEWNKFQNQKNDFDAKLVLILPLSKKIVHILNILFVALARSAHRSILARDESHAAAAHGSIGDKIMSGTQMMSVLQKKELSIYDSINRADGDCQFIATSATNFGTLHFTEKVPLLVNKDYCGIDFGYQDGQQFYQIASHYGVTIRHPDVVSQTDMGTIIGDPVFQWIKPGWYVDEEAFLKNMEKNNLQQYFGGWTDYKRKVAKSLAHGINYMITSGIKAGNKMLLRFFNDNTLMDNLLADMKPHLDKSIRIIKEYDGNHKSIKQLMTLNGVLPTDKVLLVPSAGCRMSDTLTKDFCYGWDFTNRTTTLAALLQGVLGRVCGYFKDPHVMLSDDNADALDQYVKNGFYPTPGQTPLQHVSSPTTRSYEGFRSNDYTDPVIAGIIQRFQKTVDKIKVRQRTTSNGIIHTISLGKEIDGCFLKDYITQQGFDHIEKHYARHRLMKINEVDNRGHNYFLNDLGNVVMSVRAEGKDRSDKIGGRPADGGRIRGIVRVEFRKQRGRGGPVRAIVTGFDIPVYFDNKGQLENQSSLQKIKV